MDEFIILQYDFGDKDTNYFKSNKKNPPLFSDRLPLWIASFFILALS